MKMLSDTKNGSPKYVIPLPNGRNLVAKNLTDIRILGYRYVWKNNDGVSVYKKDYTPNYTRGGWYESHYERIGEIYRGWYDEIICNTANSKRVLNPDGTLGKKVGY